MLGNNSGDALATRRAGVLVNNGARENVDGPGEPQKLIGVAEAKVLFVQYTNAKGEVEMGMYFDVGGKLLSTTDTSEWCRKLHPMSDWLFKQVNAAKAQSAPVQVPSTDSVDVIG